jgi:hypothetical protein
MKKIICRNCKSKKLKNLFSLGNLNFTGKFPNNLKKKVKKAKLNLVLCIKCKLVQLDRNFNRKYLYGKDYGYRTGINKTMTLHVKEIVNLLISKFPQKKLQKGDYVLDIGSNDGTMLSFYPSDIIKVGIDPAIKKYKKIYKKINIAIPKFFNLKNIKSKISNKKFKIITALSMFYDLNRPNIFLLNVKKILHKNGIFFLEQADLLSIIKKNIFDTICHEHLEYYSSKIICEMVSKNGLRVFDIKYNNVNGGSTQYFITHKDSNCFKSATKIKEILKYESYYKLGSEQTFKKFYDKIFRIKNNLIKYLDNIKKKKQTIHGYGASTKGNVLLQFFGIGKNYIDFISERNPQKYNCYTPGSKIKIISEKLSRKLSPDFYLVLPWHFKNEILEREKKIIKNGTKFIFPLPKLSISKYKK